VTQVSSISGALAEVVSTISTLVVWYNRDGAPGFQWDMDSGVDIFDCTAGTYDCVDPAGTIEVNALSWAPISRVEADCNAATGATTYDANCKIVTFQVVGSRNSVPVLTLTSRTVSQPMNVDGVLNGPDRAKIDVTIEYPWAQITGLRDAPNALVALIGVQAGKAVGAVQTQTLGNEKQVSFAAAGGKRAFFSYSDTATINTAITSSPIITKTITAKDVEDFSCVLGDPCAGLLNPTNLIMVKLKIGVAWLKAFLWTPQVTIHSFTVKSAVKIYWDPAVGADNMEARTSSSAILVPSAILSAVALFL